MLIDSIQNGIVIDHITAGKAMELYQILGLDKLACTVAILKNVTSGKLGRKDIIKIDGEMELDWDLIGYVDPSITVNIIRVCLPSGKQPDALGHQDQPEGDDEDRAALEQIFVIALREECSEQTEQQHEDARARAEGEHARRAARP